MFVEAGGDALRDDENQRIVKKIVPGILVNKPILREFSGWGETKEWVMEKARLLAVHGSNAGKPLHLAESENIDFNALAEMELEDVVASLGNRATPEIMLALVNKRQERTGKGIGTWRNKEEGKGIGHRVPRDPVSYKPPMAKDGKVLCADAEKPCIPKQNANIHQWTGRGAYAPHAKS